MIVLVTGTPGSAKTLFAVSKIIEFKKQFPDRKIFADIDGLSIDGVEKSPADWRDTPDNSIVIYDEAQQHERFRAGTQANKDEIVQKLQVHRHTGHDIWFITQSPRFLNAFVLDLVGEHYHLHRPYGAKLSSVYYWRSARKQPQSLASRELAENEFLFKYPKDLFNLYQSATSHNIKLKVPRKLWILLLILIALAVFVYKIATSQTTQKFVTGEVDPPLQQTSIAQEKTSIAQEKTSIAQEKTSIAHDRLDFECRKAINLDLPECKKWISEVSNVYDPDQPYSFKPIVHKEPTDFPRMSGVMTLSSGKLIAIDQQGNYMPNISQEDCKKWLNGYRPFDYFASQKTQQREMKSPELTKFDPEPSSL